MPPRKRLGQLLTELKVIDEHQLQSALGHQKQWGGKLGGILVQKGFCKEDEVVSALSKHLGMPAVKLATAKVDERATRFVSKSIAEKLHVFPYEVSGSGRSEVVTIAMSDPTDLSAVDQLAFHTGKRIKPMLAGDSEIVSAIQQHYGAGEEKKEPTDKMAKPAASGPQKPVTASGAQKPVAASGPQRPVGGGMVSGENRRVSPIAPTPSAGTPRVAPYVPPPIPVAPPKPPPQKLEEIEPDESMKAAAPAVTPPPPKPQALELPESEDDGSGDQMMGLEPIAAHTQVEEVSGAEDFAGEGSAADEMEGLESASLSHAGAPEAAAAPIEGLEPIAAHAQAQGEGWETQSTGETAGGWADTAESAPADPAAGGWADEPAAPAAEAAQDWSSAPADAWGEQPAAEAGGEQLPMDAIIGTAESEAAAEAAPEAAAEAAHEAAPEAAPEWGAAPAEEAAAPAADDLPMSEEPPPAGEPAAAQEPEAPAAAANEAEAPDAWAASEDPLASHESSGGDLAAWGAAMPAEPAWGEQAPAAAEAPAEAEAPAAEAPAETEAPPEWGEVPPEDAAGQAAAEPAAAEQSFAEPPPPAEEPAAAHVSEPPPPPPEAFEEEAAAAQAAGEPPATEPPAPAEAPITEETPPLQIPEAAEGIPAELAAQFSEEQGELKLEGWVAPPAEPEPQGAGWIGAALESTAPLSAADAEALGAVGIDPNDGVAALRLLATLVRVLARRGYVEFDELAADVAESRAQVAATAAEGEAQNGTPETSAGEQQT